MSRPLTPLDQFKDNRVERILTGQGYTFTLEEISVEDVVRYDDSQARLGALDPHFINRYTAALRNKAVFPPIVVYRNGRDGYVCLDGNHRCESGKRANHATIRAYVIKETLTPQAAVYISGVINATTNGKAVVTNPELARLVLAANDYNPNLPDERIGQQLGLSRTKVRNIRVTAEAHSRLREADIDPSTLEIGATNLRDLHTKITDDSVFIAATQLVDDASLSKEDIGVLIRSVALAPSEADKLAVVNRERVSREPEITSKGQVYILPTEIPLALASLHAKTQKYSEANRWVPLTPHQRQEFYGKVRDLIAFLTKVEATLAQIVAQDTAEQARATEDVA